MTANADAAPPDFSSRQPHHEDTIPLAGVLCVDDDRAAQLAVVPRALRDRDRGRDRPVVERAGAAQCEPHRAAAACGQLERFARAGPLAQAVNDERRGEGVADGCVNDRAGGNANQRRRDRQRPSLLADRGDAPFASFLTLRTPHACPRPERDPEHAVLEDAGGRTVVVCRYEWKGSGLSPCR